MRKLRTVVVVILCFAMLTMSAMAQGMEFRLNDAALQIGDTALDLSGLELVVDFGDDPAGSGVLLAIDTAAARIVDIAATVEGSDLILTSSALSNSYKLSIADAVQSAAPAAAGIDISKLISDFSEEDLEKLSALGMQAIAIAEESIEDGGMVEYEGNAYQELDFAFSDEQVRSLLVEGADILDAHPEITQAMGIKSLRSALENAEFKLAIEGSLYLGDAGMILDVYLNSAKSVLVHFDFTMESDEETDAENILVDFYAGDQEGEEYPMDFEICGSIALKSGAFSTAEFFIGDHDEEEGDEGVFAELYAPEAQEDGKAELIIATTDEKICIDALVSPNDDGTAEIELIAAAEGTAFDLKANVSITEAADGWMPAAKECVDILNMSEEELSTLQNEGMMVLFSAIGQLGQANSTISNLLMGSMMG